jgi:hypothetical protein
MARNSRSKGPPNFGGHTLEYWDEQWERLDGGFRVAHPKVCGRAGLYRAVLGDQEVCIGCSVELDERLQQLRSPRDLSTNRYYSARKIREHIGSLHLEVLLPDRTVSPSTFIARLKFAMIRERRPIWNWRLPSKAKGGK